MIGDSHKGRGHRLGERLLEAANGSGQFEASSKAIRRGAVGTRAPLPDHQIGADSVRLIAWRRSTRCAPRCAALDGSQHDLVQALIDAAAMTPRRSLDVRSTLPNEAVGSYSVTYVVLGAAEMPQLAYERVRTCGNAGAHGMALTRIFRNSCRSAEWGTRPHNPSVRTGR